MIYPFCIVAVDPGKKGSACKLLVLGDCIKLLDVIYFGGKNSGDWQAQLYDLLTKCERPDVVALENVHSKSMQGVKSVFTFGSGKGGCIAAIKIAGHKIHYVEQTVWPRQVGLVGSDDPKKRKAEQNAKALELFPELANVKGDIFASTLIATAVALDLCPSFRSAYMAKYAPQRRAMTPEQIAYQQRLNAMLKRDMSAWEDPAPGYEIDKYGDVKLDREGRPVLRKVTWEDLL